MVVLLACLLAFLRYSLLPDADSHCWRCSLSGRQPALCLHVESEDTRGTGEFLHGCRCDSQHGGASDGSWYGQARKQEQAERSMLPCLWRRPTTPLPARGPFFLAQNIQRHIFFYKYCRSHDTAAATAAVPRTQHYAVSPLLCRRGLPSDESKHIYKNINPHSERVLRL